MKPIQLLLCRRRKDGDDKEFEEKKEEKTGDTKPIIIKPETLQKDLARILDRISRRQIVSRAAIMDFQGNVIAATSGWTIPWGDPERLHSVILTSSASRDGSAWKMTVFGDEFRCQSGMKNEQTILGQSNTTLMTAHATLQFLVLGLKPVQTPGACFDEMKRVWLDIESQGF